MLAVEYIVESTAARRTNGLMQSAHRAVGIDMVGTVLGVVLHDKNGGFRPELTVADAFNDSSQGQVIVGHHRTRRWLADAGAIGVVIRKPHDRQLRHAVMGLEFLELFEIAVGTPLVRVIEIVAAKLRVEVSFQRRHGCLAGFIRTIPCLTNSPKL